LTICRELFRSYGKLSTYFKPFGLLKHLTGEVFGTFGSDFAYCKQMNVLKTFTLFLFCLLSGTAMAQDGGYQAERASLAKTISVYPNPATEYIEINLDQFDATKVKLSLYNIIGNEMPAETEVVDDHKIRVRVKDFAAGYYLIALRDDETKFKGTYKFLKR
jgi:hypothetical protein